MRQTFDRRSVLGLVVGSAAGAMFVSSAQPTYAAGTTYKAAMDGASEVPPTTTSGTGTVTATLRSGHQDADLGRHFSGLSGPATAAHFHGPAEAGKNAGVIVPDLGKRQAVHQSVQGLGDTDRRQGSRPATALSSGTPMSTSTPRRTRAANCAARS